MFSTSSSTARATARHARASALRSAPRPMGRAAVRFASTEAAGSSSTGGVGVSHVASGVAGGAVVLLGGYMYYRTSGIATVMDSAKQAQVYMAQAQDAVAEKVKNPNEALKQLRQLVRSYAGLVPGASQYVDATFDQLDELADTHGEEAGKIISSAYNEVSDIVKKGGKDATTATKVMEVLRKRMAELAEVAKKAGGDVLDNFPQAKEKLGGGWETLSKLAEEKGPEAKKIYDETTKQVKDIFAKGVNAGSIDDARKLIQEKTKELQDFAGSAAGGMSMDPFGAFEGVIKQIPGGEKILQNSPNLAALAAVAKSNSEDAKKLAEETYTDVMKVLKEKGEKAKKIADNAKNEAKDKS